MPHTPSHRTDEGIELETSLSDAMAQQDVTRVGDLPKPLVQTPQQTQQQEQDLPARGPIGGALQSAFDATGEILTSFQEGDQELPGGLEDVAEQPFFESSRVPGLFDSPEDIRNYVRTGQLIDTKSITVGEAAEKTARFFTEDIVDLWAFGKQFFKRSVDLATAVKDHPEQVGEILTTQEPLQRIAPLMEIAQDSEAEVSEEMANKAQRGAALLAGGLILGPASQYSKKGIVRTIGAALDTEMGEQTARALTSGMGRLAGEEAAERFSQWGLNTAIRVGTGAGRGGSFGATYGALKPLGDEEQSRFDAMMTDAVLFGALDAGIGLAGQAAGAVKTRYEPSSEERQESIREMFDFLKESLGRRNGPDNPMPAEPLTAEETAAQVAAGATQQGVTKSGPWQAMRQAAAAFSDFITKRFPRARRLDPRLHTIALSAQDAQVSGLYFGRRAKDLLTARLNDEEIDVLGKALVESRLRQVARDLKGIANKLERAESAAKTAEQAGIQNFRERFSRLGIDVKGDRPTVQLNGNEFNADELKELASRTRTEILDPDERQLLDESPRLSEALDDLENAINPVLETVKTRNGMQSKINSDLPYIRLVPARQHHIEQDVSVVRGRADITDDEAREMAKTGRQLSRDPEGGQAFGTRVEETGARTAMGQAPAYVTDIERILRKDFGRAMRADWKNEAVAAVAYAPWSKKLEDVTTKAKETRPVLAESGEPAPRKITVDGEEFDAAVVSLRGPEQVLNRRQIMHQDADDAADVNNVVQNEDIRAAPAEGQPAVGAGEAVEVELGDYLVPKPVKEMLDQTFAGKNRSLSLQGVSDNAAFDAYSKFMDFNVRMLLSSPIEATAHGNRVLNELIRIPGVGDNGGLKRIANKFGVWFGPRLTGLHEIMDVYRNPEALKMEAFLATKVPGGLPTRAFPFEFSGRGVGDEPAGGMLGEGLEKFEDVLEFGRKALFNLPEAGEKSLMGFDTRTRITAALAFRRITRNEIGRDPTPREYSEFLQDFGQYTDEIQSDLVQFLRKSRAAPFAGTQAGFIPGELKRFFGNPGLPKSVRDEMSMLSQARIRAETLWRGTIGTALMTVMTQKALTDDFPWENEPGHESDLKIGYTSVGGDVDVGGKPESFQARPVYIPLARLTDPVLGRAHRIVGARSAIENFDDREDIVPDALLDLANTAISFGAGSPGVQAGFGFSTGSAPYIPSEGKLLRIVPPQPSGALTMKARFQTLASQLNPTFEAILGVGKSENTPGPLRFVNAVTPGMDVGQPIRVGESAAFREEQAEMENIAMDRVIQALGKFPENRADRFRFYREEADKFPDSVEGQAAFRLMRQMDRAIRSGTRSDFIKARRGQSPFR